MKERPSRKPRGIYGVELNPNKPIPDEFLERVERETGIIGLKTWMIEIEIAQGKRKPGEVVVDVGKSV